MKHAKESHILWEKYQRNRRLNNKKPIKHIGSSKFHKKWIKVYNNIIDYLKNSEIPSGKMLE